MRRLARTLSIVSVLTLALAQLALSEDVVSVAGTWDVTVSMKGQKVAEQWTIQGTGDDLTATIKGPEGEKTVQCEQNGVNFRSDFKSSGGEVIKVRAGLGGDRMDGSIRIGDREYLWFAKRAKT
jgi:hypothetical protein